MTDLKPYRHRFPMTIIQHAVWLYHRLPLSYRDIQELRHQRGIQVSHETLREWCLKFGPLFAEELRHREPRRGSRWHLDEMYTTASDTGYGEPSTSTASCSISCCSATGIPRRRRRS